MARKVQVILEDDLGDGTADETVTFAVDGTAYEIDLTTRNADRLRSSLQPFIESGRRVSVTSSRGRGRRVSGGGDRGRASEMRAWAIANGIKVSERGRVSAEVVAQYEAANS